jgi:SAM-dependent methyltransferase
MSQENSGIFERPLRMPVVNALRKAVNQVFEEYLAPDPGKSLEVGCGDGFLFRYLIPDSFKQGYHGIDEHEPSFKRFQELAPEANARRGRVAKIPYPANSMDVVLGFSAYSFMNKWEAIVGVREVLKPGGRLVLFQDSGIYKPLIPGEKRTTYDEMQRVETTHALIIRDLKEANFKIVSGEDPVEAAVISPYKGMVSRVPRDLLAQIPDGKILIASTSDTGINRLHHSDPGLGMQKLEAVKSELGSPRILEGINVRLGRQVLEYVRIRFIVAESSAA